jgi:hypothetical protein
MPQHPGIREQIYLNRGGEPGTSSIAPPEADSPGLGTGSCSGERERRNGNIAYCLSSIRSIDTPVADDVP